MIRLGHHQLYGAICKFNCSSMIRFSPCWFSKHSRRGEDGWDGERRLEEWKLAVSCILSFNFNEWLAVFFCFLIVTMIRLRCIHVIAPRPTCWAMLWTLALGICGSGSVHWKLEVCWRYRTMARQVQCREDQLLLCPLTGAGRMVPLLQCRGLQWGLQDAAVTSART